jgi:hypothetical protein
MSSYLKFCDLGTYAVKIFSSCLVCGSFQFVCQSFLIIPSFIVNFLSCPSLSILLVIFLCNLWLHCSPLDCLNQIYLTFPDFSSALSVIEHFQFNSIYLFPLILYTRYVKRHVHKNKQYEAIKITIRPAIISIAANIHRYKLLIVIKDRLLGYWCFKPYTPLMINKFCWFSVPKIGKGETIIAFT